MACCACHAPVAEGAEGCTSSNAHCCSLQASMVDQDVESLEAKEEKEGLLSAVSGRTISLEVGLASEESDEDAKLSVKAVTKVGRR